MLLKLRTTFLCLFRYVLESDVFTNYHYFWCFSSTRLKGFLSAQFKGVNTKRIRRGKGGKELLLEI